MDFWATFWATMWGALAGALVGAVAAWRFSINLARRKRMEDFDDRLDEKVARVVELLGLLAPAMEGITWFSVRRMHEPPPEDRAVSLRSEVLATLRSASLSARGPQVEVIDAAFAAVSELAGERGVEATERVEYIANVLVAWRRDRMVSLIAADYLRSRPQDLPPDDPENEHD